MLPYSDFTFHFISIFFSFILFLNFCLFISLSSFSYTHTHSLTRSSYAYMTVDPEYWRCLRSLSYAVEGYCKFSTSLFPHLSSLLSSLLFPHFPPPSHGLIPSPLAAVTLCLWMEHLLIMPQARKYEFVQRRERRCVSVLVRMWSVCGMCVGMCILCGSFKDYLWIDFDSWTLSSCKLCLSSTLSFSSTLFLTLCPFHFYFSPSPSTSHFLSPFSVSPVCTFFWWTVIRHETTWYHYRGIPIIFLYSPSTLSRISCFFNYTLHVFLIFFPPLTLITFQNFLYLIHHSLSKRGWYVRCLIYILDKRLTLSLSLSLYQSLLLSN